MMVAGFSNPWIAVLYLVAQVVLFVHLPHGIPSSVPDARAGRPAVQPRPIGWLGYAVALTVLVGNCAIVLAVLDGSSVTSANAERREA